MTVQTYVRGSRNSLSIVRPAPGGHAPQRRGGASQALASAIEVLSRARAGGHIADLLLAAATTARHSAGTAWSVIVPTGADPVIVGPSGPVDSTATDDSTASVVAAIERGAEVGLPVVSGAAVLGRLWCGPHAPSGYGDDGVLRAVVDQVAFALDSAAEARSASTLSNREAEVLRSLASGLSNEEIAERLFISAGTVKFHIRNVTQKLGARNRAEAVYLGARNRII